MTVINLKRARVAVVGMLALVGLLPRIVMGQTHEDSPEELIGFLTYQSGRPGRTLVLAGISGCGHFQEDRAAAKSLARLGVSAIPYVDPALDSIEKTGAGSEYAVGAEWLLDAYAEIAGPAAFVRLRKMASNPNLAFIRPRLDSAIALSLSLTSYVSGSRVPSRILRCSRRGEPRDALDQLILSWERDDCRWLQGSLGPRASAALDSLLQGRTWADMRADLWRDAPSHDVAVGYRFEAPDWWSRPEDTLGKEREYVALAHPENPDFETRFKDASGGDCGKHRVKFLKIPMGAGPGDLMYVVDNSDIEELLGLIGSCAAGDSVKNKP